MQVEAACKIAFSGNKMTYSVEDQLVIRSMELLAGREQ